MTHADHESYSSYSQLLRKVLVCIFLPLAACKSLIFLRQSPCSQCWRHRLAQLIQWMKFMWSLVFIQSSLLLHKGQVTVIRRCCHWRHILVKTQQDIKVTFFGSVEHLDAPEILCTWPDGPDWRAPSGNLIPCPAAPELISLEEWWVVVEVLRLISDMDSVRSWDWNFDQHILYSRSLEVVEVFWFNGRPWCMQRRMSLSSMKRTPHRWKAFADAWQKVSTPQRVNNANKKGKEESETWH